MSSPANIVIRNGESEDASRLSGLAAKLFFQTYTGDMPSMDLESCIAQDFGHDQQLAELEDTNITTLLAEHDGELVGYAQVRRKPIPVEINSSVVVELWRIYLDESVHGFGIGRLLLSKVSKAASAMSSNQIWLGVWEKNLYAISFYEKHGFKVVGSQEFFIGAEVHNDIVMLGSVTAF